MQLFPVVALTMMAVAPVLAHDIGSDDIPAVCTSVCSNLVVVAGDCDRAFDDNDQELQCLCQATNAEQVISLCAACIASQPNVPVDEDGESDDDLNDVIDVLSSCSFSTTSYNPSSTYSPPAMTAATVLAAIAGTAAASATTATTATTSTTAASAATVASDNAGPAVTANVHGVGALAGAALLVAAAYV